MFIFFLKQPEQSLRASVPTEILFEWSVFRTYDGTTAPVHEVDAVYNLGAEKNTLEFTLRYLAYHPLVDA